MKKIICSLILSFILFSAAFAEVDFKFGWPFTFATATSLAPEYDAKAFTGALGFDFGYTIEGKKHFGFTSEVTTYSDSEILLRGYNFFVGGAYSIPINEKSRIHFDAGHAINILNNGDKAFDFGGKGGQINASYQYFFSDKFGIYIGLKNSLLFMTQNISPSYKYPESTFGDFYTHYIKDYDYYVTTCSYEISPSVGIILRLKESTKKEPSHEK